MLLVKMLCRQGISCDQQGLWHPGPHAGLCPPLPAAGCGVTGAGTDCGEDHSHRDLQAATVSAILSTRPDALGTNTRCLHCCPKEGDRWDGSWKPWDRLWGLALGRLVGIGGDGEQTPAGTLPK